MPTIRIPNGNITVEIELTNAQAQEMLNELTQVADAVEGDVLTKDADGNVTFQAPTGGGGTGASYVQSFVAADLVAGVLTVEHNLDQKYVQISVYNNSDKKIEPSFAIPIDANSCSIDITPYGTITGTWHIVVTK